MSPPNKILETKESSQDLEIKIFKVYFGELKVYFGRVKVHFGI